MIFKYIDLIKSSPPQEWAFQEVSTLSALAFRFKEKSPPTTTAMHLSLQMSRPYPRHLLLAAPWQANTWDPELIAQHSAALGPESCRLMVASQQPLEGHEYERKEEWYGTEYTIIPMPETLLKVRLPPSFAGHGARRRQD